jgi:prepilin-type N-terminal cleavage/methylation domain-containing protein
MKTERGVTMIELMVAVAIGGILSVVLATFFTFTVEQFYSMIDQNDTEQSLLMSSYYVRASVAQAVKTMNASTVNFTGAADATTFPTDVPVGYFNTFYQCNDIDCNTMTTNWPAGWPAGVPVTPLAIFAREAGTVSSNYVLTGLFYIPPNGATSGRIYVAQIPSGAPFVLTNANLMNHFYFDHIVAFGIASGANAVTNGNALTTLPAPNTPLSNVAIYIRARFFRAGSAGKDYSSDPAVARLAVPGGTNFIDINTTVNVSLRNNIVGANVNGTGVNERPSNGLYFYQFLTPSLQNF